MRKLRWGNAGWSQPGRMQRDVEFNSTSRQEDGKQKGNRHYFRDRNADVRGRQRALPIRRFVVVGVVLMRGRRIRVVVNGNAVNQLVVLQQCV